MTPETFIGLAGVITVAAITPGPNNFIVLAQSLRGGLSGSILSIAGIVAGTQLLLLVIWFGADALFRHEPRLQSAMTIAGAAYLFWLGLNGVRRSFASDGDNEAPLPAIAASFGGLVLFQFLNPKSWVLVLTATAAVSGNLNEASALTSLAALFFCITGTCLLIWAFVGSGLTQLVSGAGQGRWFDRAMGALLMVSAALLLL